MPERPKKHLILTLVAGPNGSGKSTVVSALNSAHLGVLVNADVIAASIAARKGESTASERTQWEAAVSAEEMRWALVSQQISFVTETVMSDGNRWIKFIGAAKEQGFRINLVFVTTSDPAINIARVASRVSQGGHAVSPDKIASRYQKTMRDVLPVVLRMVDEAVLLDNSGVGGAVAVMTYKAGRLQPTCEVEFLPNWAKSLLAD